MKFAALIGAVLGLIVTALLVAHVGLRAVIDPLLAVGWIGLAAIIAVYIGCLILCAAAWRIVVPDAPRNALSSCLWARWLRESVDNLLAFLPTAGELAGIRELTRRGFSMATAAASTIVDLTLELLSQIAFTILGVALLLGVHPGTELGPGLITGIVLSIFAAAGFVLAQRGGLLSRLAGLIERFGGDWAWKASAEAKSIHEAIDRSYRRHWPIFAAAMLHLAGWVLGAGEAFIALRLMGQTISWYDILILESLAFALRSAAFFVPARLGVQEGGYVLIGALFGLSPAVALALSLLKRAREIATGVPCLVIWQGIETRRLWLRGRGA